MPWLIWITATIFVLFQFFLQAAAGLMAESWHHDFSLNKIEIGYLSSAFFVSYVLMQIPVGLAYDRFGARKVMFIAAMLLSIGSFGTGQSYHYMYAVFFRVIMGVGSAFGFIGMLYVTALWFSKARFTFLIGISETLASVGVAVAEIIMAYIISHQGWRYLMTIAGWIALIVGLTVLIIVRDRDDQYYKPASSLPLKQSIIMSVSNKTVWLAGLYGFATFSIVNVFVNLWGVPFFVSEKWSLHRAGIFMSAIFIGFAVGGPFNAWIVNHWKNRRFVTTLSPLIAAAIFSFILCYPTQPFTIMLIVLFCLGFISPTYIHVYAVVRETVPLSIRATALSTANMILMSSALLLQPLIGKLLESGFSYAEALSIHIVLLVGASLITFVFKEDNAQSMKK